MKKILKIVINRNTIFFLSLVLALIFIYYGSIFYLLKKSEGPGPEKINKIYSRELNGEFYVLKYREKRESITLYFKKYWGGLHRLLHYNKVEKNHIDGFYYKIKDRNWKKNGICRDGIYEFSWNGEKKQLEFVIYKFLPKEGSNEKEIPEFYAITFKDYEPYEIIPIKKPDWYKKKYEKSVR